eukprot:TRINITY_DN9029_c0_g1_i1.p1 TRINITY_DN9029_c0_g1~~TRINITY_DN9029_c0_g1_i1.p1  ORF type:complete len:674 (+),score=138.82 TRINITY_DN9029_c0_g1_i1:118-2139(+)
MSGERRLSAVEEERAAQKVRNREFSSVFYGTRETYEHLLKLNEIIEATPEFRFCPSDFDQTRSERFLLLLKKSLQMRQMFNLEEGDGPSVGVYIFGEHVPLSMQYAMFLPCLKLLASEGQLKEWLEPVRKLEMLGCYAQTELGHGSDIQSLETTATYDVAREEFIINSPTVSSTKFWPGDLGKTSTHCITHAQLIINGVNFGVQAFLVPIRDVATHTPLKGITVGDIGPKLAWNIKDNGYLRFDNVRIPRCNMLRRYAKVTKEGEFVKRAKNPKIAYATMMLVRCTLAKHSAKTLAAAVYLATLYSLERRQFRDDEKQEIKLIDYQLQAAKLIPQLAKSYAISVGGYAVEELVKENLKLIETKEDFSLLQTAHALLAGTKAYYTSAVLEGTEKVRQACGGQGFSMYSGLPSLIFAVYPNVTLEGDNTLMYLQTARYLISRLQKRDQNLPNNGIDDYLAGIPNIFSKRVKAPQSSDPTAVTVTMEQLKELLEVNSCFIVQSAGQKLMAGVGRGMTLLESWNKVAGSTLVESAEAHTLLFTYEVFRKRIEKVIDTPAREVLTFLCLLFGVEVILQKPHALLLSKVIQPEYLAYLQDQREALISAIRPHLIGLVDALSFSVNSLRSAFTSPKPYETMLDWAMKHNRFDKEDLRKEILEELAPHRGKKSPATLIPRL